MADILLRSKYRNKRYFYRCDETRCECRRQNGKLINSVSILTEDGASRSAKSLSLKSRGRKDDGIQMHTRNRALIPPRKGTRQIDAFHMQNRGYGRVSSVFLSV